MQSAIFYPALVQVLLTVTVLILMGPARSNSMRVSGQKITDKDVELGRNAWDERATKIANNYKNQFELPVLFYAACAFALLLKQADGWVIGLAWVFAISRLAHTLIHVGRNVVVWRAAVFLVGALALLAMWLTLAVRLAMGA